MPSRVLAMFILSQGHPNPHRSQPALSSQTETGCRTFCEGVLESEFLKQVGYVFPNIHNKRMIRSTFERKEQKECSGP